MSPQLPLPKIVRTSDHRTRAVEYAADPELLPQVLSWARHASRLSTPALHTLLLVTEVLYTNASQHAHGPVRLVLVRRSDRQVNLAVMDRGPREGADPPFPTLTPGGGLEKVAEHAVWGWYGDQRGHTVWAHLDTLRALPPLTEETTP